MFFTSTTESFLGPGVGVDGTGPTLLPSHTGTGGGGGGLPLHGGGYGGGGSRRQWSAHNPPP